MTIEIKPLTRVFQYNGMALADIDRNMTPEEIRDVYAAQYGELTTAETIDHGIDNGIHKYQFLKTVGTKG